MMPPRLTRHAARTALRKLVQNRLSVPFFEATSSVRTFELISSCRPAPLFDRFEMFEEDVPVMSAQSASPVAITAVVPLGEYCFV